LAVAASCALDPASEDASFSRAEILSDILTFVIRQIRYSYFTVCRALSWRCGV
jgi:hypothetical protein